MEALSESKTLLNDPDATKLIHPGHIYSAMVKALVKHGRYRAVRHILRHKCGYLVFIERHGEKALRDLVSLPNSALILNIKRLVLPICVFSHLNLLETPLRSSYLIETTPLLKILVNRIDR